MDTPAQAGGRLIIPSLTTPIGGVIAGYTMSRGGRLGWLVRCGTAFLTLGNVLIASLCFTDANWKYFVFLIPANLGLGMTNPSVLFSFVSAFEHRGMFYRLSHRKPEDVLRLVDRSSGSNISSVSHSVVGNDLWSYNQLGDCPKRARHSSAQGIAWS